MEEEIAGSNTHTNKENPISQEQGFKGEIDRLSKQNAVKNELIAKHIEHKKQLLADILKLQRELVNSEEEKLTFKNLFENSEEVEMESYDKIIRYINNAIPYFTGKPSPTLTLEVQHFITCCNLVYNKLENEEKIIFMQVIKIKMGGDAADVVNNSIIDQMEQLEQLLTTAYVPRKTLQSLTEELKRAIQRPGERALEFGLRVEKLMKGCKNMARKEYSENNEALLTIIEKDAIKAFKQGLSGNAIKYYLTPMKRDTLSEMIKLAEEIEEESAAGEINVPMTTIGNGNLPNTGNAGRTRDEDPSPRNWQANPGNSNYSHNRSNYNGNLNPGFNGGGYNDVSQRFNNNYNNNQNNQRNNNNVYNNGNYGYAQRRYNNNYSSNGNMTRSYNNNANSNNLKCFKCGRMGHAQSQCRTRSENSFCSRCRKYGHQTNNCSQGNRNVAAIDMLCEFCQRTDHSMDDCLYKQRYENKFGMPKNGTPDSVSDTTEI